jgi:hypothetical protein
MMAIFEEKIFNFALFAAQAKTQKIAYYYR